MAAHLMTALQQEIEKADSFVRVEADLESDAVQTWLYGLEAALNSAPWVGQLDYDEWLHFKGLIAYGDVNGLQIFLKDMLVEYAPVWKRLGYPATYEDWLKARSAELEKEKGNG